MIDWNYNGTEDSFDSYMDYEVATEDDDEDSDSDLFDDGDGDF